MSNFAACILEIVSFSEITVCKAFNAGVAYVAMGRVKSEPYIAIDRNRNQEPGISCNKLFSFYSPSRFKNNVYFVIISS